MAISEEFAQVQKIYEAIKDIDLAKSRNSEELLDEVLHAVADIDKSQYPKEYTNTIVDAIRASLMDIYKKHMSILNGDIGITNLPYKDEVITPFPRPSINVKESKTV